MTDAEPDDDSQSDSLLFWFVIALFCFAAAGFVAGVLYPFYM